MLRVLIRVFAASIAIWLPASAVRGADLVERAATVGTFKTFLASIKAAG